MAKSPTPIEPVRACTAIEALDFIGLARECLQSWYDVMDIFYVSEGEVDFGMPVAKLAACVDALDSAAETAFFHISDQLRQ